MEKLVKAEINRLVVVDDDEKVVGVVSVSDIIHYLVLSHSTSLASRIIRPARLRQRREDSIGEEVELEEEESDSLDILGSRASTSCSPPRWFNV